MFATIENIVDRAEMSCRESGARLTAKRKNVLLSLLRSKAPLSAYEIADRYKIEFNESIPTMSVYRMLDFLIEENLVHKLNSTNKYVACSHITCNHHHEVPQFMICDKCNKVEEVGAKQDTIESLRNSVESSGFSIKRPQLELHGLCHECLSVEGQA